MKLRWQDLKGPLTVALVATMILFIAYTSQVFVIWPYLGLNKLNSILIIVPLNFFVAMIMINYFLTCKVDPGSVPSRWVIIIIFFLKVNLTTLNNAIIT
jgi:palmitoyltransferase